MSKKKKKTQARNVSPSRPSSKRVCYVCVCVLEGEGEGEGTRTYLRLGSPPGRSSSVSRCVVEGRRKTRVRGLVVLGSVTWFFFFSPFFGDSHQELGDGGHGCLVRFSLSLSLSCRGLARALRGDAGRVRVRARVCTSSGLPFPFREGGEDLRTTRFLLDFPR